jgi:hypothetical protein
MALTALGAKGSILLDQYISEFGDPWQLTLPYDDFHGAYELATAMRPDLYEDLRRIEASLLVDWSEESHSDIAVSKNEFLQRAKKSRLADVDHKNVTQGFDDLVGTSVGLKRHISKSHYRLLKKSVCSTKAELESSLRERWLLELVGIVQDAVLPVCGVASKTHDPVATIKNSFGNWRGSTLRARARAWKKVREWLHINFNVSYPQCLSQMLDYMAFLDNEGTTFGKVNGVAAALSLLEDAGQVHEADCVSKNGLWRRTLDSLRLSCGEHGAGVGRKAPRYTVAIVISLELGVCNDMYPTYLRAIMFAMLLCCWCSMRVLDLQGLNGMKLSEVGLRATLWKTKTTGVNKRVKQVPTRGGGV